jgi:hypothetical protein
LTVWFLVLGGELRRAQQKALRFFQFFKPIKPDLVKGSHGRAKLFGILNFQQDCPDWPPGTITPPPSKKNKKSGKKELPRLRLMVNRALRIALFQLI